MNPFSLYWKSSWAVSSAASPPGRTTRCSKRRLAWYASQHWYEWPDTKVQESHSACEFGQTSNLLSEDVKKHTAEYADLPSSATLVVSLKLLQWLRVSMEASSSLKGCTCPCCPPEERTDRHKRIRVQQVCVSSLCNTGTVTNATVILSQVLCTLYAAVLSLSHVKNALRCQGQGQQDTPVCIRDIMFRLERAAVTRQTLWQICHDDLTRLPNHCSG